MWVPVGRVRGVLLRDIWIGPSLFQNPSSSGSPFIRMISFFASGNG